MQFKEWLRRNGLTTLMCSIKWGMQNSSLHRMASGQTMPSLQVIARSYELSQGEVTHLDWIETARGLMVKAGMIERGERFYEFIEARGEIAGPKPTLRSGRKAQARAAEGEQEHEPSA